MLGVRRPCGVLPPLSAAVSTLLCGVLPAATLRCGVLGERRPAAALRSNKPLWSNTSCCSTRRDLSLDMSSPKFNAGLVHPLLAVGKGHAPHVSSAPMIQTHIGALFGCTGRGIVGDKYDASRTQRYRVRDLLGSVPRAHDHKRQLLRLSSGRASLCLHPTC